MQFWNSLLCITVFPDVGSELISTNWQWGKRLPLQHLAEIKSGTTGDNVIQFMSVILQRFIYGLPPKAYTQHSATKNTFQQSLHLNKEQPTFYTEI